jgi:hypothetical protein
MIKKITRVIFIGLLICFSFYYTEKCVDLVKYSDPIMKKIKTTQQEYKEEQINATIINDEIIPGYNGLSINLEDSYQAMKRLGDYNQDSLVFEEVNPDISITNNYDKYIVKGNYLKDTVGLVFELSDTLDLDKVISVLDTKNTTATFITTNKYLEENGKTIYNLAKEDYEIELNVSSEKDLIFARNTLKNNINYSGEYCYLEEKNDNILKFCSNNKMHSVIPTFTISNFKNLKENLEGGAIIKIEENEIKELSTIINYIKQRGYSFETLTYLLSENRTVK